MFLGRRDYPEQSLHSSSPRRENLKTCLVQPVGAPADGNEDRTRCQRRMTLSLNPSGKNGKKPLLGVVCLLTTGVLIRVRPGPAEKHRNAGCFRTQAPPSHQEM